MVIVIGEVSENFVSQFGFGMGWRVKVMYHED